MQMAIDIIPDYYFYDGHAKLNWDLGQNDRLSVSTYFGYDQLDIDLGTKMFIGWGNKTASAQWMHIFNPRLFSHFILANSSFNSEMEQKSGLYNLKRNNRIEDTTLKAIMSYTPNNSHLLEFGFETKFNEVDFVNTSGFDIPKERIPDVQVKAITNDLYIQDAWKISPFWTFQPGVRASSYNTLKNNLLSSPAANFLRVSPRASLRRVLTVDSNIYVNYGRYYQFLAQISPGLSTPLDVWIPIDGSVSPSKADHYILGYKHELMEGIGFDIELYYKDMKGIVDYNWDTEKEWNNNTVKLGDVLNSGNGDAKGIDVLLRTDVSGLSGFLGYSYGTTRKKLENTNINPQTGNTEYFYPKYDRNHQINLVQNLNITEKMGWQLWGGDVNFGMTYAYATGQPTAVPEQIYYIGDSIGFLYSYQDAQRLPAYSRLDLSLKLQYFKRSYSIEPYLQVINVTNRSNVFSRSYYVEIEDDGALTLKHSDVTQFPLIPFIGVNIIW
jgi:hypothetical protein